jgi:hypothetical protein
MARTPQFDRNDELEQQLWDLAYALLDEDEADVLQGRIDDHPSVADLWVKVKDQVDLVASATRYDGPFIELARPDASSNGLFGPPPLDDIPTDHEPRDVSRSQGAGWTWRTAVNWITPIASAAVLLLAVAPNWLPGLMPSLARPESQSRIAQSASEPLQIVSPQFVDGEADYYVAFRSDEPVDIAVRDDSDELLYKKRYVASEGSFKLPKPKNRSSLNLTAKSENWGAETTIEFLAQTTPSQPSNSTTPMAEDFGTANRGGPGQAAVDSFGAAASGGDDGSRYGRSLADQSMAGAEPMGGSNNGNARTRNRASKPYGYLPETEDRGFGGGGGFGRTAPSVPAARAGGPEEFGPEGVPSELAEADLNGGSDAIAAGGFAGAIEPSRGATLLKQTEDGSVAQRVQGLRRGALGQHREAKDRRLELAYLSTSRELGKSSANVGVDSAGVDSAGVDSAGDGIAEEVVAEDEAKNANSIDDAKRDSLRRVIKGDRALKEAWGLQVEPMRDHLEPGSRGLLAYRFDGHPAVRTLEFYFAWGDKVGPPIQVDLEDSGEARVKNDHVGARRGILAFDIPENVLGPAVVKVVGRSSTGEALRLAEELPVEPNMMRITPSFDSGVLAAELPGRVHILAEDGTGQGVASQGRVVDNEGTEVATFKTDANGRGRFDFQPVAGRAYRFEAVHKNIVAPDFLPDGHSFAALAPENGNVEQVESSIRMRLNSTRGAETVLSVVGRDENDRSVVFSQSLSLKTGSNDVNVALPDKLAVAERVIGTSSDGKLALFNKTLRPRVMDEYNIFDDQDVFGDSNSRFRVNTQQSYILMSAPEPASISEEQFLGLPQVSAADDMADDAEESPSQLERSLASVQIITGSSSAASMQMHAAGDAFENKTASVHRDSGALTRNRWLAGSALCLLVGMGLAAVFQISRPRVWAPVVAMCGLTLIVVLVDTTKPADERSVAENDESFDPEPQKAMGELSDSGTEFDSFAGKVANEAPESGNRPTHDLDADGEFDPERPSRNRAAKQFLSEDVGDTQESRNEKLELRMNATSPIAPALAKQTRGSGRATRGSDFFDGFGREWKEFSSGENEQNRYEARPTTSEFNANESDSDVDQTVRTEAVLTRAGEWSGVDKRRAAKTQAWKQGEYFLWVEQQKTTDRDPSGLAQSLAQEDNQKLFVEVELLRRLSVGDRIQTPVRFRNLDRSSQTLGLNWASDNRSVRALFDSKMLHIEANGVEERLLQLESVRPEASTVRFSVDSTNGRNQYSGTIEVVDPRVPLSLFASGVDSVAIEWKPELWQPLSGLFWYYPSTAAELEGVSSALRMQPVVTWDQLANVISSQALHLRWLEDAQVADVDTIRSTKQVLREWLARAETPAWRATLPDLDRTPPAYRVASISEMTDALRVAKNVTHVTKSLYETWEARLNDFTPDVDEDDPQSVSASAYAFWKSKDCWGEENQHEHRERLSGWSRNTRSAYLASLSCLTEERVMDDVLQIVVNAQLESGEVPAKHLTATGSRGRSRSIESTALAAMAFGKANRHEERDRALNWLRSQRRNEKFGSSQASYLAFRALSNESKNVKHDLASGKLRSRTCTAQSSANHESQIREITLALPASDGNRPLGVAFGIDKLAQSVELGFEGQVQVPVELRVLGFANDPLRTDENLNIEVRPSRTKIDLGEELTVAITATNAGGEDAERVVATIPIPAGFVAADAGLAEQRRDGRIDGYSMDGVQVLIFWEKIAKNAKATSELQLHGRAIGDVQAAAPSLHRLADPEMRAWDKPWRITVGR